MPTFLNETNNLVLTVEENVPLPQEPDTKTKDCFFYKIAKGMEHGSSILIEEEKVLKAGENPRGIIMKIGNRLRQKGKKVRYKKLKNGDYRMWCENNNGTETTEKEKMFPLVSLKQFSNMIKKSEKFILNNDDFSSLGFFKLPNTHRYLTTFSKAMNFLEKEKKQAITKSKELEEQINYLKNL